MQVFRSSLVAVGVFAFAIAAMVLREVLGGGDPTDIPLFAVADAVAFTPFFATWVMPNSYYFLPYVAGAIAAFFGAGWVSSTFFPLAENTIGRCGMPLLGALLFALIGLVTGVGGRGIGLAMRGRSNPVLIYMAQLLPFVGVVSWIFLSVRR